jgi:hypothetical protein
VTPALLHSGIAELDAATILNRILAKYKTLVLVLRSGKRVP